MTFCKQCSLQFFNFDIFKEHILFLHQNSSKTLEDLMKSTKKETLAEATNLDFNLEQIIVCRNTQHWFIKKKSPSNAASDLPHFHQKNLCNV